MNNPFETELLLAKTLNVSRSYLYTHPVDINTLSPEQKNKLHTLLQRREQGEPMAYILGTQGFWSLDLEVNPHTLIPRPCTELLVELILKFEVPQLLDLGTGSGAIALAIASERPHWQITASDRDPDTLAVAKRNAERYNITHIHFVLSDWFAELPPPPPHQGFDAIVSNPPYIKIKDPHLKQGDLRFEPQQALVSGPDGLTSLRTIIKESPNFLKPGGYLFLEHGFDQGEAVRNLMKKTGYTDIQQHRDLESHERVVVGKLQTKT